MTLLALRFAALVAAAVTIVLNAVHGYQASATLEFAIMLAALQAALDMAKCALIPAGIEAWRARAYILSLLAFLLFPLLFLNSVWSALSQVALTRDAGKATAVAQAQTRNRAEATHARLAAELALLQANPTFAATAACAAPKSTAAKSFCATVAQVKRDLAAAETALAGSSAADPNAPVTLIASLTGTPVSAITFTLAVVPVLLAELVGSLGFAIAASRAAPRPPGSPETPIRARWPGWLRRAAKTPPARVPEASAASSVNAPPIPASGPHIQWTFPGAGIPRKPSS